MTGMDHAGIDSDFDGANTVPVDASGLVGQICAIIRLESRQEAALT
jgi:hypothetical protein